MSTRKRKPKKSHEEVRRSTFVRRTGQMFQNHRREAKEAGAWIDYDAKGLRLLVSRALAGGCCPYCQGELDEWNFSADHRVPVCRTGTRSITNLLICCLGCNLAKGPLDHVEWRQLMNVMGQWSHPVRQHTIARLKAGGARIKSPPRMPTLTEPVTPTAETGEGLRDKYGPALGRSLEEDLKELEE